MRRVVVSVLLSGALQGPFAPLGAFEARAQVAPALEPEPEPVATTVTSVEIVPPPGAWDAMVLARPWPSAPPVGSIARGVRVAPRGTFQSESSRGCPTRVWFALEPVGWICSNQARERDEPAAAEPLLEVEAETALPYRYAMVSVPEGERIPMWASLDDLRNYSEPERDLMRGDTLAVRPEIVRYEGAAYRVTVDGKVLPVEGTFPLRRFSSFQGVAITDGTHLPFGWVLRDNTPVLDAPSGDRIDALPRRARVDLLGEEARGSVRWLRVGEGRFVRADRVNEVRRIARPEGTGDHPQWIDIDLGEQVVVAYERDRPVYATLTSTGRGRSRTPRGNYPVWAKALAITMKAQPYDEKPYYVDRVPWALFFQGHNALHGAYWHDRFGVVKSHGCANLSPRDARHLFDWMQPALPPGWTGIRDWDLSRVPVVHVRNSRLERSFVQARPVGPPDPELEAARLAAALERQKAEAAAPTTEAAPDASTDAAASAASGSDPPSGAGSSFD